MTRQSSCFSKVLASHSQDYWAIYRLAEFLRKLGNCEKAIFDYDQALTIRPHDFWSFLLGKLELALNSYDLAIKIQPDDYWTWYQKGTVLQQLELYQQAIEHYNQVLELDARFDLAWYQIACCYLQLHNCNWAILNLEKAIDLQPEKYLKLVLNQPLWKEYFQQIGFQLLITNKSRRYDYKL